MVDAHIKIVSCKAEAESTIIGKLLNILGRKEICVILNIGKTPC